MKYPESIRKEAIRMRVEDHASLLDVSRTLDVAKSTASLWLREYPLPTKVERDKRRQNYIKTKPKLLAAKKRKAKRNRPCQDDSSSQIRQRNDMFDRLNSKGKGTVGELEIALCLLRKDIPVLVPFGDNDRYDLVAELPEGFKRIQCKIGKYDSVSGTIRFATCSSSTHRGGSKRTHKGEVDFFGVYCESLRKCYLVNVDSAGDTNCTLRVTETQNGINARVRWAKDYEI